MSLKEMGRSWRVRDKAIGPEQPQSFGLNWTSGRRGVWEGRAGAGEPSAAPPHPCLKCLFAKHVGGKASPVVTLQDKKARTDTTEAPAACRAA